MPTIYDNEGHRRSAMANYHRFVFKIAEWRRDPRCRFCHVLTHMDSHSGKWKTQATLDHKLARGLGGTDVEDNFELLCGKCNNVKSKVENKLANFIKKYDKSSLHNNTSKLPKKP